MTPIEFRGNFGTGLVLLYNQRGMSLEADCSSGAGIPRLRSTVEDSFASANIGVDPDSAGNTPQEGTDQDNPDDLVFSDPDMDTNQPVLLGTSSTLIEQGHFAFSGGGGTVVTGVFVSAVGIGSAQGDCVFVGTLQSD